VKTRSPLSARFYDLAHTFVRANLVALLFFLTAGVFTIWISQDRDFPLSNEYRVFFICLFGRQAEIPIAWDGVFEKDEAGYDSVPVQSDPLLTRWLPFMLAYSAVLGVFLTLLMRGFPRVFRRRWKYPVYGAVLALAGIGVPLAWEGLRTLRAEIATRPVRHASGDETVIAYCWDSNWRSANKLLLFGAKPGDSPSRGLAIPFPACGFIPDTLFPETVWRIPLPPFEMKRMVAELEEAGFFHMPSISEWWDCCAPFDFLGVRTPAGAHALVFYPLDRPEVEFCCDIVLARAWEHGDLAGWQLRTVRFLLDRIRDADSDAEQAAYQLVDLILPIGADEEVFLEELGAETGCESPLGEGRDTILRCFDRWALLNLDAFDPKKTQYHSQTSCRLWLAARARREARAEVKAGEAR